MQVLVYQSMMKSERQVSHALWHEFGHVLFGDEKQFSMDLDIDTPMRSCYAVFNELIAEYMGYFMTGGEGFGTYNPNMYLQMAFPEQATIIPYWLSRYIGIIMEIRMFVLNLYKLVQVIFCQTYGVALMRCSKCFMFTLGMLNFGKYQQSL